MNSSSLQELLQGLQNGELSVEVVTARLEEAKTSLREGVRVDLDLARRCGFPQVGLRPGKSVETLTAVFTELSSRGQDCLVTRVSPEQRSALQAAFSDCIVNELAGTVRLERSPAPREAVGRVVVVTAGSSDRAVAEEALETLRWMHCSADLIVDVGVAGPHRLLEVREQLEGLSAVVVVAGMEGALPSVVGGWVDCPVIAVPTSVGYGASLGGMAALLSMLNSCAANVTVVNIDAGFKAGYVAGLIATRRSEDSP